MKTQPPNGYLTIPETARALGRAETTIREWIRNGQMESTEDHLVAFREVVRHHFKAILRKNTNIPKRLRRSGGNFDWRFDRHLDVAFEASTCSHTSPIITHSTDWDIFLKVLIVIHEWRIHPPTPTAMEDYE